MDPSVDPFGVVDMNTLSAVETREITSKLPEARRRRSSIGPDEKLREASPHILLLVFQ